MLKAPAAAFRANPALAATAAADGRRVALGRGDAVGGLGHAIDTELAAKLKASTPQAMDMSRGAPTAANARYARATKAVRDGTTGQLPTDDRKVAHGIANGSRSKPGVENGQKCAAARLASSSSSVAPSKRALERRRKRDCVQEMTSEQGDEKRAARAAKSAKLAEEYPRLPAPALQEHELPPGWKYRRTCTRSSAHGGLQRKTQFKGPTGGIKDTLALAQAPANAAVNGGAPAITDDTGWQDVPDHTGLPTGWMHRRYRSNMLLINRYRQPPLENGKLGGTFQSLPAAQRYVEKMGA